MQGGCSVVLSTSGWWTLFEMRNWRKIIANEDVRRDETVSFCMKQPQDKFLIFVQSFENV
jgi:hypothetical protein